MPKKRPTCPRCESLKVYVFTDGRLRCAPCRFEWRAGRLPLRLSRQQWRQVLHLFLLGLSSNKIAQETGVERRRVLRALERTRQAMAHETAALFQGTVEVDETYLGGQWRNKRRRHRQQGTKRGRGTSKTPVFGILCRGGNVWAQIVPDTTAKTLLALLESQVKKGSTVCSDTWRSYTGIAYKGSVHRTVDHSKGAYSASQGTHINGLEGFWGYLKRQLAAKGGIRRDRLPLYLAEYVWKYNHRKRPRKLQENRLLQLLHQQTFTLPFRG